MPDGVTSRRDDWSSSGFFGFEDFFTKYASDGTEMFRQYAPFDGDWFEVDDDGLTEYEKAVDLSLSRAYEKLTSVEMGGGGTATAILYRSLIIPRDFGRSAPNPEDIDGTPDTFLGKWPAGSLVGFAYKTADVDSIKVSLLTGGAADAGVNAVDVTPGSSGAWEAFSLSPTGTYIPGQECLIKIEVVTSAINAEARIAAFIPRYLTARGNT